MLIESDFTKMSQFGWFCIFPGTLDIPLFQQFSIINFSIFRFGFVLFCCASRMPFICMLDLCFQTFSSVIFSTCFHLLVLFLCILCSFLKTAFHIIHFALALWVPPLITLIYLLVLQWFCFCLQLLSSIASFPFISSWCPIIASLISSVIESLLIVEYDFLLCHVPSE